MIQFCRKGRENRDIFERMPVQSGIAARARKTRMEWKIKKKQQGTIICESFVAIGRKHELGRSNGRSGSFAVHRRMGAGDTRLVEQSGARMAVQHVPRIIDTAGTLRQSLL
jgi:hypothetical protein